MGPMIRLLYYTPFFLQKYHFSLFDKTPFNKT